MKKKLRTKEGMNELRNNEGGRKEEGMKERRRKHKKKGRKEGRNTPVPFSA